MQRVLASFVLVFCTVAFAAPPKVPKQGALPADAPLAPPKAASTTPAAAKSSKPCDATPIKVLNGPPNPAFDEARELFTNFQFDAIIPKLNAALLVPGVTNDQKVEIYKLMAFTYTSLEQPADAQEAFIKILEVQEDSSLSRGASPRFLAAFSIAQKMFKDRKPVKLQHEKPQATAGGLSASVDVVAVEGQDRIDQMSLHYRVRDSRAGYSELVLVKGDDGSYSGKVPTLFPGPAGRKTIEYFIRAREKTGASLASIGDEKKPLEMMIDAQELELPVPLYKNWVFWSVVGVVVASASVAIPVATRRDVPVQSGNLGTIQLGQSGR